MAIDFQSILYEWQNYGLYTVVLPFLLIFALVFATLEKINLFKDKQGATNGKINAIIALVMGLLAIQSEYIVTVMNNFIPNVSMLLIVVIMFLIVAGLIFGKEQAEWGKFSASIAAVVGVAGVLFALLFDNISQTFDLPYWLELTDQSKANLLVIGGIVLAIWWITKPKGEKPQIPLERLTNPPAHS